MLKGRTAGGMNPADIERMTVVYGKAAKRRADRLRRRPKRPARPARPTRH